MKIDYLKVIVAVTAVVLFTDISASASEVADVRHVSGEITWIDLKLGKLELENDISPGMGEITEYRINQNETRVNDPADKKFLTIADLHPGQHVTIDVINGKEEMIVQKITADLRPTSDFQEAYGEIEAIDAPAGTLSLSERPGIGEVGESHLSHFVFEPKNLIAMRSPSKESVQLNLKPGDLVKVEFTVRDGKRQAQYITLYSPRVTRTTTTTTTTVIQ